MSSSLTSIRFGSQPVFSAGQPAALRFQGNHADLKDKNLIWISFEGQPYTGGLGMVTAYIPKALKEQLDVNARAIVPYIKGTEDKLDLKKTNLAITVHTAAQALGGSPSQTKPYTFEVWQGDFGKTTIYALRNEELTAKQPNLYFAKEQAKQVPVNFLFDQAASVLATQLAKNAPSDPRAAYNGSGEALRKFDAGSGKADAVIFNDALGAGAIDFLKDNYPDFYKDVDTYYFFHNEYGASVHPIQAALFLDLKDLPEASPITHQYAGVEAGIRGSSGAIMNQYYAERIMKRGKNPSDPTGTYWIGKLLHDQYQKARLFDMHHGIDADQRAQSAKSLNGDGFANLNADYLKLDNIRDFKAQNKAALQKWLGLEENPNAVIFCWSARFDSRQKGVHLVLKNVERMVKWANKNYPDHPLQFVIFGSESKDPVITDFIAKMPETEVVQKSAATDRPERFVFKDKSKKHQVMFYAGLVERALIDRMYAGSDFVMLPSMYEPFGLTQLEAMAMGTVPVTNWVDGIRSSVADPDVYTQDSAGRPVPLSPKPMKQWEYGQTGYFMQPIETDQYINTIGQYGNHFNPLLLLNPVIREANNNYFDAMKRAFTDAVEHPDAFNEVRRNGLKYVNEQHSWGAIAERFYAPLLKANAKSAAELDLNG